jgi:hypothetical protein
MKAIMNDNLCTKFTIYINLVVNSHVKLSLVPTSREILCDSNLENQERVE